MSKQKTSARTPKEANFFDLYEKYVIPTYTPEIIIVRGEGAYLWDVNGIQYIDFSSGIGVCNIGHCNPKVAAAIGKQAKNLDHISNLYMNPTQPILANKLCKQGFNAKVFFANSGAEANEAMVKFARKFGSDKGKYEIITMENSFHGRTLATLSATGQKKYMEGFEPEVKGFKHVPFNDIDAVKNAIGKKTVAVMVEPIQGEGGVIPAEKKYLQELRELCDAKGILLLFDEVQCGIGRTGTFFAFQGYGVEPDALTLAKALGNGFPIGALLVKEKYADVLDSGSHASTFGGNPMACAAATAVIDVIYEQKLLANCREMSTKFFAKLKEFMDKYQFILAIRGKGLMIGVEVPNKESAKKIVEILRKKRLLALTAGGNTVRFLPPLSVTQKQIFKAFQIINEAFSEFKSLRMT